MLKNTQTRDQIDWGREISTTDVEILKSNLDNRQYHTIKFKDSTLHMLQLNAYLFYIISKYEEKKYKSIIMEKINKI